MVAKCSYTYVGPTYRNVVVARIRYWYYFQINIRIVLTLMLIGNIKTEVVDVKVAFLKKDSEYGKEILTQENIPRMGTQLQ